ncbi:MAG TPA: aromatic acid exporter family protein [Streptosporangiaceae bacterium]
MPVRIPMPGRRPARRVSETARTVAQRTPHTLMVVRFQTQPAAVTIARLASTAIFAYLIALALPGGTPKPVLAPLTALLVAQATLYQTVRSAVKRVAAVVAGVLVAVVLSDVIGFSWWSLGITIVAGLALGYLLRLGDTILEVPISAMLILSVGSTRGEAATGRIAETLVGAGAGLAAGIVMATPRVESAHDAIGRLCRKMADLLDQIAAGLNDGTPPDSAGDWLAQARGLSVEIRALDEAVRQAEDSIRLNPRTLLRPAGEIALRQVLETLEHAAITLRGLARSIADLTQLGEDHSSMREPEDRARLAGVLRVLAAAVRDYGRLATQHDAAGRELAMADLDRHLEAAREQQDLLSLALAADPADRPVGWPLRGELVSHIDRLRGELQPGSSLRSPRDRVRSWRLPARALLRQRAQHRGRRSADQQPADQQPGD